MTDTRAAAADAQFDLIVLGGGSGGLAAAFRAAAHGKRVAMLEPGALGGTCVNVGCVPKKAMWLAADLRLHLGQAAHAGFQLPAGDAVGFDWDIFVGRRQAYIEAIHASYRKRLDEAGVEVLPVRGRLAGPGGVSTDDGRRLTASRILLATGSHPLRPRIPGAELGAVSDDFFGWREAPARVAIIGGGYIGTELAGVLHALGSRVDVFVRGSHLLAQADPEVAAQLEDSYRRDGIGLVTGYSLAGLQRQADGRLCLQDADGAIRGDYDQVMFATGRGANTRDLGLDSVGIETAEDGRIPVDEGFATAAPGVYAVGDVCDRGPALTPVATASARRLCDHLFGGRADARLDLDTVPTVVFSHPPLAMLGMTEARARQVHGDDVQVFRSSFRPMRQALLDGRQRSLFKLVCVGEACRVVGVHLLGEAADEILQGFAVAVKCGATLEDFRDTIAIHPTSAEEVVLMR